MQMENVLMKNNTFTTVLGLLILISAFITVYLPWRGASFMLVPALFVLWLCRSLIQIDSRLKLIFGLFLGYLIIFTVLSDYPRHSVKGSYDILRGCLFFPIALVVSKLTRQLGYLWLVILPSMVLFGNLAFPRIISSETFYSYYFNPNNAAVHLIALTFLTLPWILCSKRSLLSFAVGSLGPLCGMYLLALTNSRGAWLGFAIAVCFIALIRQEVKLWWRVAALVFTSTATVVMFLFFNFKGVSLSLRGGLWQGLLDTTTVNNPFTGFGVNSVKDVIDQIGLITRTAHNLELEIYVSSGLLGITMMSIIVYLLFRHVYSMKYDQNVLWCVGVAGIIAFLVMGQFDLKFASMRFFASISFFFGLIYGQRIIDEDDSGL